MKSSKDIPPRVGMQVRFMNNSIAGKIMSVHGGHAFSGTNGLGSGGLAWCGGGYVVEWTPPTDDERRLFMDGAKWREKDELYDHSPELCAAALDLGCKHMKCHRGCGVDILESLALDGADYDNMPDFYELER